MRWTITKNCYMSLRCFSLKEKKVFLLVCATFYVLNVNNNIAFSYLRFLLSTERLSHIHTYDVEEYKRIITHANIFVNLHTYIPQKNKVSFYSFCCYRERSCKRRKRNCWEIWSLSCHCYRPPNSLFLFICFYPFGNIKWSST